MWISVYGVKILNLMFFGVEKSAIIVFLVSAENGAGVNKMTNITYAYMGWFTVDTVTLIQLNS